jgi:hypothetical protein
MKQSSPRERAVLESSAAGAPIARLPGPDENEYQEYSVEGVWAYQSDSRSSRFKIGLIQVGLHAGFYMRRALFVKHNFCAGVAGERGGEVLRVGDERAGIGVGGVLEEADGGFDLGLHAAGREMAFGEVTLCLCDRHVVEVALIGLAEV